MAIFKVTAVPDFSQLKSEVTSLQRTPVKIAVDAQPAQLGIQNVRREVGQLGTTAEKTGSSISSMFTKIAAVSPIYAMVRAFQSALDTMKAVNDELIAIQKVTGYTTQQMDALTESAYKLATQYGRSADEVLSAATAFARAGYGEQAESLAELSLLTQNVGDVSADAASKFLIAADAAWKLGGNEDTLMRILDGLNEVTNRNAVDMDALTEAITVGGSVFAEAGESAQTFTALVGAAVSATQRSGGEVARALRTILMNIRQIRGELEDGELVDGQSIANASNALRTYAGISTTANGQLRRTSAVLEDLAAKWETLDTVAQSAISEALAGKRQANVLMALMGNWETVGKAIRDYADGAGSALAENEFYLQGWTAKSKQLDAAWTEFVSHLIDTGIITDALDTITSAVDLLDSEGGHLIVTIGGITAAVLLLGQAKKAVLGSEVVKDVKAAITAINALKDATVAYAAAKEAAAAKNHAAESALTFLEADRSEGAAKGLGKLGTAILNLGLSAGQLGLIAAGIAGLVVVVKTLADANDKANRSMSDFDAEIGETNEQLKANKERLDEINSTPWNERSVEIIKEKNALEAENKALQEQVELLQKQKLEKAQNSTGEGFQFGFTNGSEAYETILDYLDKYTEQIERTGQVEESQQLAFEKTTEAAARQVEMLQYLKDSGETLTSQEEDLIAAYERLGSVIPGTTDATAEYVSGLVEEARQAQLTGAAMWGSVIASIIDFNNTNLDVSQKISALQMLAEEAQMSATWIAACLSTDAMQNWVDMEMNAGKTNEEAVASYFKHFGNKIKSALGTATPSWQSNNYTPSGNTSKTKQTELDNARKKAAQATIDAIKRQRDAETDAIDEQIEALKKQNEETERGEKLEELKLDILKRQDALLNARNERTVRQYNAATGQWEWVADAQKVKDAEDALEDAKKDLRDYERDTERELAIEELEARKKAIEATYQLKIDTWQKLIDELNGDVETEAALLAASLGDWETYYQEMLKVYQKLLDATQDYEDKKQEIQNSSNTGGDTTGGNGGGGDNGGNADNVNKIIEANRKKENDALANLDKDLASLTPAQRSVYNMWMSRGTGSYYAIEQAKKAPKGDTGSSSGGSAKKTTDTNSPAYTPGGTFLGGYKPTTSGSGSSGTTSNKNTGSRSSVKKPSPGGGVNKVARYDSGGVLHGLGGIKATVDDEMVLPPDVTRKLLTPSADSRAVEAIAGMRMALNDRTAYGQSLAGVTNNDRHDVTYNYSVNGVTLSPQDANRSFSDVIKFLADTSYHMRPFSGM